MTQHDPSAPVPTLRGARITIRHFFEGLWEVLAIGGEGPAWTFILCVIDYWSCGRDIPAWLVRAECVRAVEIECTKLGVYVEVQR